MIYLNVMTVRNNCKKDCNGVQIFDCKCSPGLNMYSHLYIKLSS